MSNSNQKLVLSDAFGNKIDEVQYIDDGPWPDADGNGKFLHLTDTVLDNSQATSWVAEDDILLTTASFTKAVSVMLYPNPVKNTLTVASANTIKQIEIYDIYGKLLQSFMPLAESTGIEFGGYATGIYIVKVTDDTGFTTKK